MKSKPRSYGLRYRIEGGNFHQEDTDPQKEGSLRVMKKPPSNFWGSPSEKPIFSPSKLLDFSCGLRFDLRWKKRLGIQQRMSPPPTLGTLVHAGEAAIDLGKDGSKGIESSVSELAKTLHFQEDSPLLSQLSSEAKSIVLGIPFLDGRKVRKTPETYQKWVSRIQKETPWEVLAVEKRIFADVGPLILAPKLDLVIEDEIGLWVVERKTRSSTGKDSRWGEKFRLNLQILAQVFAAETFFKNRVQGAMIRGVFYSRQNSRNWTSDLPQGLSNVQREDPQWIRRNSVSDTFFFDLLVHVRNLYEKRNLDGSAPAEGLLSGSCPLCPYQRFCRGEVPSSSLIPLPMDEVSLEEERRRKKTFPKKTGLSETF